MSSHGAIFVKTKNKNWYTKAHVIQLKTIALVQSTLETVDLCIKFAQIKKWHLEIQRLIYFPQMYKNTKDKFLGIQKFVILYADYENGHFYNDKMHPEKENSEKLIYFCLCCNFFKCIFAQM